MLNFKANTGKRKHKAKAQRIKSVSKEIFQKQLDTKTISLKGCTTLVTSPNADIFVLITSGGPESNKYQGIAAFKVSTLISIITFHMIQDILISFPVIKEFCTTRSEDDIRKVFVSKHQILPGNNNKNTLTSFQAQTPSAPH